MNHLEKYHIVKLASACGPSGCGSSLSVTPKKDSTPKVVAGTGYGPNRDRAPVTHKVPDQRPPATNMTRHQTRVMSDLYRRAVQANPQKYQNVPFRELSPDRQMELLNAYQNKTPVSPYRPPNPGFRDRLFTSPPRQQPARRILL